MKSVLRQMSIGDYDRMLVLWQSCQGVGLAEGDSREGTRRFLRRNAGFSFVAEKHGRIIGTALCGHDGRRGFLYHLAVAAEERRRGLARRLVEACLARLRVAKIPKCHIVVFAWNRSARQFWCGINWKQRDDLVLMSKFTDECRLPIDRSLPDDLLPGKHAGDGET